MTNRSVTRIECKSDEANVALTRIEQVLADIVNDITHGSMSSSIVSDERWNIWAELKLELRVESYPSRWFGSTKTRSSGIFLICYRMLGQDDVPLNELGFSEANGCSNEAHSWSSTQIQLPDTCQFDIANIVVSNLRLRIIALLRLLLLLLSLLL